MQQANTLNDVQVRAFDTTRQRFTPSTVSREATVGEWVVGVAERLGLKSRDLDGNPYVYRPRLEREGRLLNPGEIVGEVLRDDDVVVLHANVNAG